MIGRHLVKAICHRAISRTLLSAVCLIVSSAAWALTDTPPQRTKDNLIVAVYNIQWLGEKPHDLDKLAEVIQRFDVCGIVEIKDESALAESTGLSVVQG